MGVKDDGWSEGGIVRHIDWDWGERQDPIDWIIIWWARKERDDG